MSRISLINLTGADRKGIFQGLSNVLARHEVRVLDVGQSVIHDFLTMALLVRAEGDSQIDDVVTDLASKASEFGLEFRATPLTEDQYETWVQAQGKARHIITLFGPEITAWHLEKIGGLITSHEMNIDVVTRLSGRVSLQKEDSSPRTCIEFSVRGVPDDSSALRKDLLRVSDEIGVDIAIQLNNVYRRNRRLVAFDMDSTLIQTEVIDELAACAGAKEEVAAITELAMNGELDFQESLRRRLATLKGLPETVLQEVAERLPLTEGAERLVRTLQALGYKTAILSGGFSYFAEHLQRQLGIDYVHANELEIRDGKLTGKICGEIVDGPRKARLLQSIAEQEGIRQEQIIAVGDGANDLPMLNVAGLGIAFRAKPKVKASAEQVISAMGLDGILYLIGMCDREINQA